MTSDGVDRDERLIEALRAGTAPAGDDELARLLSGWRDDARRGPAVVPPSSPVAARTDVPARDRLPAAAGADSAPNPMINAAGSGAAPRPGSVTKTGHPAGQAAGEAAASRVPTPPEAHMPTLDSDTDDQARRAREQLLRDCVALAALLALTVVLIAVITATALVVTS